MSTVIERAQQEAERRYATRGSLAKTRRLILEAGAAFAATVTADQVEAAAYALWRAETEYDYAWEPNRDGYLALARAAFRAAGFEVTS